MQFKPVAEYSDPVVEAFFSRRTVLDEKTVRGRSYRFWHCPAGYECAGNAARYTDEKWAILVNIDGASHGRTFRDYDAARDYWHSLK